VRPRLIIINSTCAASCLFYKIYRSGFGTDKPLFYTSPEALTIINGHFSSDSWYCISHLYANWKCPDL